MARPVLVGTTAAAALPAALAAAVLVSAPFAGTTTNPLTTGGEQPRHAGHARAANTADVTSSHTVPSGDQTGLVAAEALALGVAGGSWLYVRRRDRRPAPTTLADHGEVGVTKGS